MDDINPNTSISDHRDTFVLDKPFVLTQGKNLVTGMPYMYIEGNHSAAVRLLKVWQDDNIIYLDVQKIQTLKTFRLSWNLNYNGDYWLWSLADFETLTNLHK